MIKKLLLILTIVFFMPHWAQALEDNSIMNLKTGKAYVMELDSRPMSLQNSNPKIVTAEVVTNIEETDSSIVLTTHEEGIAYINFKLENKPKTIKLLIDNNAVEDTNLLIIDLPDEDKK